MGAALEAPMPLEGDDLEGGFDGDPKTELFSGDLSELIASNEPHVQEEATFDDLLMNAGGEDEEDVDNEAATIAIMDAPIYDDEEDEGADASMPASDQGAVDFDEAEQEEEAFPSFAGLTGGDEADSEDTPGDELNADQMPFNSEEDVPAIDGDDPFAAAMEAPFEDDADASGDAEGGATLVSVDSPSYDDGDALEGGPADQEEIKTVFGLQAPGFEDAPTAGASDQEEIKTVFGLQAPVFDDFGGPRKAPPRPAPRPAPRRPSSASNRAVSLGDDEESEATVVGSSASSGPRRAPPRPAPRPAPRRPSSAMNRAVSLGDDEEGEATTVGSGMPAAPRRPPARPGRPGRPAAAPAEDYEDDALEMENDEEAPPKKSKKLLFALVAVGLVLALGGAGVVLYPKLTAPKTGYLTIAVTPESAEITVSGEPYTPGAPLELMPGQYVVASKAEGFEPQEKQVDVVAGQQAEVALKLKEIPPPPPPPPPRFTLKIGSTPEGATVTLNGEEKGVTPLTLEELDPEVVKEIALTAEGYESQTQPVSWSPESGDPEVSLEIELAKLPPAKGKAKAKAEPKKPAPKAAAKVEPVKAASKPAPPKADAKPAPQKEAAKPAAAKGKTGKLIAATKPAGAEISIDGAPTGRKTPVAASKPIEIAAGERVVVFTNAEGKTAVRIVNVKEGETVKLLGVSDFN